MLYRERLNNSEVQLKQNLKPDEILNRSAVGGVQS
jgi:hypothetical protein